MANSYTASTYNNTYSIDKYSHYFTSSYTNHEAIHQTSCPGAVTTSVCLGYKYTQQWDCWYTPEGNAFDNECNGVGSTKDSCSKQLKDVDALYDCNLDDKGTTCGAWAIINGNMQYLDDKEVDWKH